MPAITAAKGQINLALEDPNNPGMVPAGLTNAPITATMTLSALPTVPATGRRLVIWIMGSTATGTFTITGQDNSGNAITEGPISFPVAPANVQSAMVGKFEYVTTNVYGSVTNITTTGGAGATVTVWTVAGAKYLVPGSVKSKRKFDRFSPNEHRNILDKDTRQLQLINKTTLDNLDQVLYPENSLFYAYMLCGAPTSVTTLPASPTSLLAATPVGSATSLTTQPTAPGMALIFTITAASASGSISITGKNQYGINTSETVKFSGNGTFYSANVYSVVNASGIAVTGGTGGSVAIGGVFGWKYTFLPQDTVYSALLEKFDGVDSYVMPWTLLDSGEISHDVEKELNISGKGIAQDRLVIGVRSNTFMNTNQVAALGQPLDMPMAGWSSACFLDPSVATIGTNSFGDLLSGKFSFKSPQKPGYTTTQSQNYNRVNRGKRETNVDAKIDLTNVLQLEQFRQNLLQYLTLAWYGQPIGGGNNKTWQVSTPIRYEDFEIESMPSNERVEASCKLTAEYDASLGGAYQLTVINQQPPVYAS